MDISFHWKNDDLCEVWVEDEHLFDIDYITYGREGMHAVIKSTRVIAEAYGIMVHEYNDDIDEDEE